MDTTTNDGAALADTTVFLAYFKDTPDHRQPGKVVYPLDEILLLCLLAVLAGAETFTDIARFGEKKLALLRRWDFQPPASPALDPFVVDDPARPRAQHFRDLAVAKAAILASEFDDVGGEPLFILPPRRNATLRRTMLSEHAADPAFGHFDLGSNMVDAGPATRGA